jgi:hypothetical protein
MQSLPLKLRSKKPFGTCKKKKNERSLKKKEKKNDDRLSVNRFSKSYDQCKTAVADSRNFSPSLNNCPFHFIKNTTLSHY